MDDYSLPVENLPKAAAERADRVDSMNGDQSKPLQLTNGSDAGREVR
jgi:hypothetical protein